MTPWLASAALAASALALAASLAALRLALRARRLEESVRRLEDAAVSSVMEEGSPIEAIRAERVLSTYLQLVHTSPYKETWAMEEARRMWGLKD